MSALSKLKKGKAGGRTEILPELLRHGGAELHDRLLKLVHVVERVLPESQCGFRKGRGCNDAIFAARQLVEKCRDHDNSCLWTSGKPMILCQDLPFGVYWRSVYWRSVGFHQ